MGSKSGSGRKPARLALNSINHRQRAAPLSGGEGEGRWGEVISVHKTALKKKKSRKCRERPFSPDTTFSLKEEKLVLTRTLRNLINSPEGFWEMFRGRNRPQQHCKGKHVSQTLYPRTRAGARTTHPKWYPVDFGDRLCDKPNTHMLPQTQKAELEASREGGGQRSCAYLILWDGPHRLHHSQGHQMLDKRNPLSQL